MGTNLDSAIVRFRRSIVIARKINYQQGLATALTQQGHAFFSKGRVPQAKNDFDEAIATYEKLHDQNGVAACYTLYGRMYNMLADFPDALIYLNKALAIIRHTGNQHLLADCYKNVGIVYFSEGMLSKALDFYYNALFISVENHDDLTTAELNNDLGVILRDMGLGADALKYFKKSMAYFQTTDNLFAVGTIDENIAHVLLDEMDYDQAGPYIRKAYPIASKLNNKVLIAAVYTDVGLYTAHQNNLKKGFKYLDTAFRISKKYHIDYNQYRALVEFANLYNQQKDYKRALICATEVQVEAKRMGNLYLRLKSSQALTKADSGLNDMKNAFLELKNYQYLKDGISNSESLQKLTSYNYHLDLVFEKRLLEQQQHERAVEYQQNVRVHRLLYIIFAIIVAGLTMVVAIFYFKQRKERKINRLLKTRNAIIHVQKTNLDVQADKLTSLNSLKDRLIAVLAHDLRAPLSTLRGLFDLLQDDSISHEELLGMIPGVIKKLEYTSDFLDTLLFWINSQMENFENTIKSFSVAEVLNKTIMSFEGQFAAKGIILKTAIPKDIVGLADPESIGIVVRNLLTNAIKFCDENDVIQVSAMTDQQQVLISVRDTGEGMSPEQVAQLFKGKVTSQPGTRQEPGTGMGLQFCKELIEKCGGTISVTSSSGQGSEFVVAIPIGK